MPYTFEVHIDYGEGLHSLSPAIQVPTTYSAVGLASQGPEGIKKTKTFENEANPHFDETFTYELENLSDTLTIDLFEIDGNEQRPIMNQVSFPINQMQPNTSSVFTNQMSYQFGDTVYNGKFVFSLKLLEKVEKTEIHTTSITTKVEKKTKIVKKVFEVSYKCNIKLESATNLIAADKDGKSDPYVVLQMIGTDNSIMSKVVENSLNPKWDEELQLDGYMMGSDSIQVLVYDKDSKVDVKKNPCIGVGKINIDDLKFGKINDLSVELRKTKKGKPVKDPKSKPGDAGVLKLKIQPSGIQDKAFEEKEYNFVPVECAIQIINVTGAPEPIDKKNPKYYVAVRLSGAPNKQNMKTHTIKAIGDLDFDEQILLNIDDPMKQNLNVILFDRSKKATKLGKLQIDLSNVPVGSAINGTLPFELVDKTLPPSYLSFRIHVLEKGKAKPFEGFSFDIVDPDALKLSVKVIEGKELVQYAGNKKVQRYVICNTSKLSSRSRPSENPENPRWEHQFQFVPVFVADKVNLCIKSNDSKDINLGQLELDLKTIPINQTINQWYDLQDTKSGQIHLEILITKPEIKPVDIKYFGENESSDSSSSNGKVAERDIKLDINAKNEYSAEYCSFSWGTYSSRYSTNFSSAEYTKTTWSSISSREFKYHSHHKSDFTVKPKVESNLHVKVIEAEKLIKADLNGTDSYVVLTLLNKDKKDGEFKTNVIDNNENPKYNQEYVFDKVNKKAKIDIAIYQKGKITDDFQIAHAVIPLESIDFENKEPIKIKLEKPTTIKNKIVDKFIDFGAIYISFSQEQNFKE